MNKVIAGGRGMGEDPSLVAPAEQQRTPWWEELSGAGDSSSQRSAAAVSDPVLRFLEDTKSRSSLMGYWRMEFTGLIAAALMASKDAKVSSSAFSLALFIATCCCPHPLSSFVPGAKQGLSSIWLHCIGFPLPVLPLFAVYHPSH